MASYDFHQLSFLPPEEEFTPPLNYITDAYHAVGELKGRMFRDVINPHLIVAPLLNKEAVVSSKIEGTQTTVREVLKYEASKPKQENPEILEVLNYRKAIYESVEYLEKKPSGENLIRMLHKILLSSVRGKERDPGNYRRGPVHLGKPGSPVEEAVYIPPGPEEIEGLMKNWVEFVHEHEMDLLIKVAVSHYQFEAIHPFLDGNGRVGRLLVPIVLFEQNLISYPYFYISEYFEKHRSDYYEALRGVDRDGNWEMWIRFFLVGVRETAIQMQAKVVRMYDLYGTTKEKLLEMNSQYAQLLLDLLFEKPIIASKEIHERLSQPSSQTLYNLMDKFEEAGIITEITGNKRNKMYAFGELLDIIG
ncbi:MAG: Fic family protein [Balneolaceae bacterium]|nr:Fic family protein [Balneolaceae bacterium]